MSSPAEIKERVNILLVDDQPGKLLTYEVMLAELDENLVTAPSAKEALAYLLKTEVAVILVDVCMPELDGFELAEMIREHPRFQKTAIIFISAVHLTENDYLRGYAAGAVEYLTVPVVPELLRAKVRVFAELFRKTRDLEKFNNELEHRVAERTEALALSADSLRQSEQSRGLALAAGNMGSWNVELGSGAWFWDEGQSHIFGVDHASFVPTLENVREALYAEDIDKTRAAFLSLNPGNTTCETEFRIVRPSGEIRWCNAVAVASFDAAGTPVRFSGVTTDITERKETEARQLLLAREVDHRARNTLAVVQAIVRLAKRDSIKGYVRAVEGRIGALAKTHELLAQSRWKGADIRRLILDELAPYHGEGQQRAAVTGPHWMLVPEQAQLVAMAVHELATNAAKYGSLSVESGTVDVSWQTEDGRLFLNWIESGGPEVKPPAKLGFGVRVISSLGESHRGRTHFDWRRTGLNFTLELRHRDCADIPSQSGNDVPAAWQMSQAERGNGVAAPQRTEGLRLLLVEDEPLVGLFMQDLLISIGYQSTDPIGRLSEAVAAATQERFDGALLDMNLHGEMVYPLAELLTKQRVPFVFVTGYAPRNVDPQFAAVPILQKPVALEELTGILKNVLGPAATISTQQRAVTAG